MVGVGETGLGSSFIMHGRPSLPARSTGNNVPTSLALMYIGLDLVWFSQV